MLKNLWMIEAKFGGKWQPLLKVHSLRSVARKTAKSYGGPTRIVKYVRAEA